MTHLRSRGNAARYVQYHWRKRRKARRRRRLAQAVVRVQRAWYVGKRLVETCGDLWRLVETCGDLLVVLVLSIVETCFQIILATVLARRILLTSCSWPFRKTHARTRMWRETRRELRNLNRAAVRVQLAWYRRNGEFATFVLMRCLSWVGDRQEIQVAKEIVLENYAVRKLQQWWHVVKQRKPR